MNNQLMGIIIGGFIPAILFGIGGLLQKTTQKTGISMSWYIVFISAGVLVAGLILLATEPTKQVTIRAGISSFLIGLFRAFGMVCVAIAISIFGIPLSTLAMLYNINTLVAVILGFIIYAEWKVVNAVTLVTGTVLIVIGGTVVANS